ncbi:Hypothetical_protein [Hexamita inflata]|uniref:Hypothetical_protein n=1 Tax=Hexamita inflata TaxID=28002 RepID=A0AA86UUR2_9EUKA|nr:Hypothetical protein HINF_LOCUS60195 [Hexamita inflata]
MNSQKQQRMVDDRPLCYVEPVQSSPMHNLVQTIECGICFTQVSTPSDSRRSQNINCIKKIDKILAKNQLKLQINESSESKQIFHEDEAQISRIATITTNMKYSEFNQIKQNNNLHPQQFQFDDEEISLAANQNYWLTPIAQLQQYTTSAVSNVNMTNERIQPSTSNNKPMLIQQLTVNSAKLKLELEILKNNADAELDIMKQKAIIELRILETNAKTEQQRVQKENELQNKKAQIELQILENYMLSEQQRIAREDESKKLDAELENAKMRIQLKKLNEQEQKE